MAWRLRSPEAVAANEVREKCKPGALKAKEGHDMQNCETRKRRERRSAHSTALRV